MSDKSHDNCPYCVGQRVVYKPSARGKGLSVMIDDLRQLQEGEVYEIEEIVEGKYVVVKGCKHPGGGLYWTEFTMI